MQLYFTSSQVAHNQVLPGTAGQFSYAWLGVMCIHQPFFECRYPAWYELVWQARRVRMQLPFNPRRLLWTLTVLSSVVLFFDNADHTNEMVESIVSIWPHPSFTIRSTFESWCSDFVELIYSSDLSVFIVAVPTLGAWVSDTSTRDSLLVRI